MDQPFQTMAQALDDLRTAIRTTPFDANVVADMISTLIEHNLDDEPETNQVLGHAIGILGAMSPKLCLLTITAAIDKSVHSSRTEQMLVEKWESLINGHPLGSRKILFGQACLAFYHSGRPGMRQAAAHEIIELSSHVGTPKAMTAVQAVVDFAAEFKLAGLSEEATNCLARLDHAKRHAGRGRMPA